MDIRKGDTVMVLSGAEKGKTGKVLSVNRKKETLIVERIRLIKRHTKAGQKGAIQGGIIEREGALPLCKVALVDPRTRRATRIRHQFLADGSKVRIGVGSGDVIEKG